MEWTLLAGVDEADRREIIAASVRRRFARNEVIFHEGDPGDSLHLIAKGRVLVRVASPAGDVVTLEVLGVGDAFGEQALLSPEHRRTASVVAAEAVETLTLRAAAFEDLVRRRPEITRVLVEVLAEQVRRLSGQVRDALFVPADKRVLREVLRLARIYDNGDGEPTVIALTQEDLASMAGTTRPTANRALQRAVDDGAIALSRGRITLFDADGVAHLAR